jgi:hypothetical protein
MVQTTEVSRVNTATDLTQQRSDRRPLHPQCRKRGKTQGCEYDCKAGKTYQGDGGKVQRKLARILAATKVAIQHAITSHKTRGKGCTAMVMAVT